MWHNEAVTRLQPRMERKSKMKKKVLSIYSAMIALMLAVMLVVPGGNVLNVPAGQWHSLKSLESGTVLLECKDGKWEPLGEGDVMTID